MEDMIESKISNEDRIIEWRLYLEHGIMALCLKLTKRKKSEQLAL